MFLLHIKCFMLTIHRAVGRLSFPCLKPFYEDFLEHPWREWMGNSLPLVWSVETIVLKFRVWRCSHGGGGGGDTFLSPYPGWSITRCPWSNPSILLILLWMRPSSAKWTSCCNEGELKVAIETIKSLGECLGVRGRVSTHTNLFNQYFD